MSDFLGGRHNYRNAPLRLATPPPCLRDFFRHTSPVDIIGRVMFTDGRGLLRCVLD